MRKILLTLLLVGLLASPQLAAAVTFNPNYIISDNDLTDKNALTATQVQKFLEAKGGALAGFKTSDPWGVAKTAAEIINNAAKFYTISPKYLLVTLQKEQSIVSDPSPTQYQYDWATGYGVCDSCSTNDPTLKQYKGFFNQVNWSARRNRQYIESAGQWNFKVGNSYTIDNQSVTMENQATVNLYTYTPHISGNRSFWNIWNRWFAKNYPDGSLLQVQGKPGVYLIQYGLKRPITSQTALLTRFKTQNVIQVSQNDLDAYSSGQAINFANFSLVRSKETGRIYLIDGLQRRYIETPQVFQKIGFNPEEVVTANESELASYATGTNINMQSIYPTGVLLRAKENGGISYVESGVRHSIWSREILANRYPNLKPVTVEQATIDQYPKGDPVLFVDGTLVTSPSANGIYVTSNGQRRGIKNMETFNALGYQWKNIIRTTDAALLNIHPLGEPLNVNN